MKRFTTAVSTLALTLALGTAAAQADSHSEMTDMNQMSSMDINEMQGELIRTRDITGGTIYSLATSGNDMDDMWESSTVYDEAEADWDDIGEIEDIVLSRSGQMIGIVAEIGGFLDVGDKHVMISVSDVNLVAVDDATYAYVTRLSEEELEELPSVDEGFWD